MSPVEYQSQSANNPQCTESSGNLFESVNTSIGLPGSNKMEILLFSLGTQETFGINVTNVREVCPAIPITKTPNMPAGMDGLVSLRECIIPVLAMGKLLELNGNAPNEWHSMIVAKYNRHLLGFLVHKVDRIIHVDRNKVRPVEGILSGNKNMVTATTRLPDGKLVSLLSVAQVLASVFGDDVAGNIEKV